MMSEHAPSSYERTCYYNGIAGEGECPELIYRSDYSATSFPEPTGRFAKSVVKSVYGADDTPLGQIWSTISDQVRVMVKAAVPKYSCIDVARFYTHGPDGFVHNPDGETDGGSLGPATIWVGVPPGSTSADTAHDVSQLILGLLLKNDIKDAVVEWRDAVVQKLSGPKLLRSTRRVDATFQARHFLTNALSIPLTTSGLESVDSSGTMTMFLHLVRDASGNPTDKVLGLTNCHVLRDNWKVTYEFHDGDDVDHVRVCSMRRFQRGLSDIMKLVSEALYDVEIAANDLLRHEQTNDTSEEGLEVEADLKQQCQRKNRDIDRLQKFHDDVLKDWSNLQLQRNIGHVLYAPAITVDVNDTRFTADWGVFEAAEPKVSDGFEGNVVFLGAFRLSFFRIHLV